MSALPLDDLPDDPGHEWPMPIASLLSAADAVRLRVDAARRAMESARILEVADAVRVSLAVVLADALADDDDAGTLTTQYRSARAEAKYAKAVATQALEELRDARLTTSISA